MNDTSSGAPAESVLVARNRDAEAVLGLAANFAGPPDCGALAAVRSRIGGGRRWSRRFADYGHALGRAGISSDEAWEKIEDAAPWPEARTPTPAVLRAYGAAYSAARTAFREGAGARCAAAISDQLASEDFAPGDTIWSLEGMIVAGAQAADVDDAALVEMAITAAHAAGLKIDAIAVEDAMWQAREACRVDWFRPSVEAEPLAESGLLLDNPVTNARDLHSEPEEIGFDLEAEPGLLGDIARWCSAMAFRPVQEFAQPAALATLAALFGRRSATPTGLGLNLYIVGIAETGGGKDALVTAPRTLLSSAGLRHLIGPGDFTSDAAIEAAVRLRPAQLMCIDEFGKLAQAMTGRAAPAFAKLAAKSLLELYPRSSPNSEWTGKQRAGDGRDSASEVVFSPTLSLIGVSTPAGFFEGMTESSLEDGMLNRLSLVIGGRPGARQKDPARLTPPPCLLDALKAACEASTAGNLSSARARDALSPQTIRCVPWHDGRAERAIERVEEWEDEARDAGRNGVCGRAAEQTQKVATLRALARDPAAPAVTAEDVAWAWSFVRASIRALETGARDYMSSNAFEELVKAIEREVFKAGPGGLPYSKLLETKTVAKSEPRLVNAATDRLKERGVVVVDIGTTPRGGRPGKRIRPCIPE